MKQAGILVAAGALVGLAWGHADAPWLFGLAVAMPWLWNAAGTRWTAGAVALAYYLAASRGLPPGAGVFFEASAPAWFGWSLWIGVALINAFLWWAMWSKDAGRRIWLGPLILVLTAIPPIGLIGWTNPLTAAGLVFPEMGFAGLLLFLGFIAAGMRPRSPAVLMFAAAGVVANVAAVAWPTTPAAQFATWSGHNTSFPKLQTAAIDILGEGQRVMHVLQLARRMKPGTVAVLPETVLPRLSAGNTFTAGMLEDVTAELQAKGSLILVGAEKGEPGEQLRNMLVVLGQPGAADLVQRVPVPIGMWRPWRDDAVQANLWGSGIGQVAGARIAYSICYEQLLVYPVVVSMAFRPAALIGAANDWWAKETSIPAIQAQALGAWGRLFAVPVIEAVNA